MNPGVIAVIDEELRHEQPKQRTAARPVSAHRTGGNAMSVLDWVVRVGYSALLFGLLIAGLR